MNSNDDDFFQLPHEIPYSQILQFSVKSIVYKNNGFIIKITKKCYGIPEDQQGYELIRNHQDFVWLVYKVLKQSPHIIIMPYIETESYWQTLKNLTEKLTNNSKIQLKKQENKLFHINTIEHILNLISKVTLKYLYKFGSTKNSSLYTFLDNNFDLYKLKMYQKEHENTLDNITGSLGSGGKKIMGFMTKFLKKQEKKMTNLENQLKNISQMINNLIESAIKYENELNILNTNFLALQNSIQNKQLHIYQIILKSQYLLKRIEQIEMEIKFIQNLCENSSIDPSQKHDQIKDYKQFISSQIQSNKQKYKQILQQFLQCIKNENVKITISEIYPNQK